MQLSDLSAWIDGEKDAFTARLAELVNLNTFTDNVHGVDQGMDILSRWAQAFGFQVEVINGRHRLINASHRPDEATPVLLIAHMDTVHPPDKGFVQYEPLEDGFVRGPGVGDIKGGLLMGLWTMKALAEMDAPFDVALVVSADEEKGSPTIQDWYLAGSNGASYALGLEPGFPQGALGMDTPMGVVHQRKGCGRIAFELGGQASHAGGDPQNGLSAIEAMAHRVLKIQALNDHNKGITTNVGVIQGGTAANTIPASAHAEIDFRFLTQLDGEATRDTLHDIIHNATVRNPYLDRRETVSEYRLNVFMPPMESSPANQVLVEAVLAEAEALQLDVVPIARGGGSDANYVSGGGIPAICGMGAPAADIHTQQERILLPLLWLRLAMLIRTTHRLTAGG